MPKMDVGRALDFFGKWTPSSAWAYGLVLGDGHVKLDDNGGRVMFGGQEDVAWKLHRLLGQGRAPYFKGNIYQIYADSRPLAQWFRDRGIESKKSTSLPWPDDIPKKYMGHFMRGLFDTDGHFVFEDRKAIARKGRTTFIIGFSSATPGFLASMLDFIGSERKATRSTKVIRGKTFFCYSFRLGMSDSIILCRRLYHDSSPEIRSDDRFEKYQRGEALWARYQAGCRICGDHIHTGELCTKHMWEAKKLARPDINCADCAESIDKMGQYYTKGVCCACFHRRKRREKNPDIVGRVRRPKA